MKKILKKIGNVLRSIVVKYHKCEKNNEIHSYTYINDILVKIELQCSICNKYTIVEVPKYLQVSKSQVDRFLIEEKLKDYFSLK